MSKFKSYFKTFKSVCFWLVAFLVASLLASVIVANYDYNLIGFLYNNQVVSVLKYGRVLAAISLFLLILYLSVSIKKVKGSLNDSVSVGLIILGVFYTFYCVIALRSFNTKRIVFIICTIVIGLGYLVLRAFVAPDEKTVKNYTNGSIKGYFGNLVKKYPLFLLGFLSIILSCASYLFFAQGFIRSAMNDTFSKEIVILCSVLILPFIVYSVRSSISKKITAFDAILSTGVIVLPLALVQLLMKNYSDTKMILWAIALGCFIVAVFLRIKFYEVGSENTIEETCACKGYFSRLVAKYDFSAILSLAGVCAIIALVILRSRAVQKNMDCWELTYISHRIFPVAVVTISALLTLATCAIIAYFNAIKKSVGIGDFALAVCDAFVIFGFLVYTVYPSAILMDLLIGFGVYAYFMTILRVVVTAKK